MERDLNVILNVLAPGYEVNVTINGRDIGIIGRKAESIKLFGTGSPMAPVLPEDMKNLICLKEGDNSIQVRYKRVDDSSSSELVIELQAREQFVNGATLYARKEKSEVGKEKDFSDCFTL